MKNKGFTLIELLAVIVILAIIALIATPIVLSIINQSRSSARVSSAGEVVSSVETAYAVAYMLTNNASLPTLSQVKENFKMKNAEWKEDNTIVAGNNVSCTVTTADNVLKVDCGDTGKKTSDDQVMTLSTE